MINIIYVNIFFSTLRFFLGPNNCCFLIGLGGTLSLNIYETLNYVCILQQKEIWNPKILEIGRVKQKKNMDQISFFKKSKLRHSRVLLNESACVNTVNFLFEKKEYCLKEAVYLMPNCGGGRDGGIISTQA